MLKRFSLILFVFCVVLSFAGCKSHTDVTTESTGRIYNDTDGEEQEVLISTSADSGDTVVISEDSREFTLDCRGLVTGRNAYVFIDGDIDNPLTEFSVATEHTTLQLQAPKDRLSAEKHTVQVVQFNGKKVPYCRTVYYSVRDSK